MNDLRTGLGTASRAVLLGFALCTAAIPAANAEVVLNLSSEGAAAGGGDGLVQFDGDSTFGFTPDASPSFNLSTSEGALGGIIEGEFTIGAVDTTVPGYIESAQVSGTGTISIFGGTDIYSLDVSFMDLVTVGTVGGFNTQGTVNLFSNGDTYTGSNTDLKALADLTAANGGTLAISFQFVPGLSVSDLKDKGGSTSYSGTITAVPIPAAAWLFGSALVGMVGVGHRRRSRQG